MPDGYDVDLNRHAELLNEDPRTPALRLPHPEGGDGPMVFAYWKVVDGDRQLWVTVDTEDMCDLAVQVHVRVNEGTVFDDIVQ